MHGTQVEPGISQFRRLWATSTARTRSTTMRRPDLNHSPLFMLLTVAWARPPFRYDVVIAKPQIVTVWLCYLSAGWRDPASISLPWN